MRSKKVIIPVIIAVFVIVVGGFYYLSGISAVSYTSEEVVVTIENGQSASSIVDTLDDAGLVSNRFCASIFLRINNFKNLQANTYIFNKNMNLSKIFTIISSPTNEYILSSKITIIEGQTMSEIADTLASEMNLDKDEVTEELNNEDYLRELIDKYWFLTDDILQEGIKYPLEGYLYPDTYYLNYDNNNVKEFVELALDRMDEKLTPYKEQIEEGEVSIHDFLTFASIVESEALFDDDRPIIAGVFVNRLKSDMLLQSDVTVNYAWDRTGVEVSTKLLTIDSPYNTYRYKGLPIGPISSVSDKTMEACLNYTEHNYYYFFAKENGEVIYSESVEDHNQAVKENKWY